ncbi:MAG: sigma-70 family RNA polymerase sigma factor [Deltaproteobacteria bacterium]
MDAVVMDPDADLVERAKCGDMKAMEQLYRRHHGAVYAYALRSAGAAHLADEITQDTFVRAFRGVERFRGGSKFSTWLFSIAVNCTRSHLAKRTAKDDVPLDEAVIGSHTPEPSGWLRRRLEAALATLPEGYREVVVMHDVLQMPHEEIAQARNCTVGTSKSQLHKARAKLRALLGDEHERAR